MSKEKGTALTSEERLLVRKIGDLLARSEKTYTVLYSHFLTPAEQGVIAEQNFRNGTVSFVGGYEDAERRLCRLCAEEYCADNGAPVILYHITATAHDAVISHRDVLGSLMGLGIKREMLGDISAKGNEAWVFCHSDVSGLVEMELDKISRYRVEISVCEVSQLPPPETEALSINVSSLRLDSICAEGFGLSRTKAAEFIKSGAVSVNWGICCQPDREICDGDSISLRGRGKIRAGRITGVSKKGRLFVEIHRYI